MCGIVGFVGKQNAAPILLKGLQQLEYRGYDSAGIAVMDDDRIRVEKVSGRIARLCEKTEDGAAVPGTIALIDEGQPVLAVCCNEALSDKTLSNIVEVKARGAKVLALAFRGNRKIVSQADDVIFIPRIETIFSARWPLCRCSCWPIMPRKKRAATSTSRRTWPSP